MNKPFPPQLFKLAAFSLIEAVIVLGVIALVVAGIWIAAAHVQQSRKVGAISETIMLAARNAQRIYSRQTYPSTINSYLDVTQSAVNSGVFVPGTRNMAGPAARTPNGYNFNVTLDCYSICPMLAITLLGPGNTNAPNQISQAECIQIIRRVSNIFRSRDDFTYIQIRTPGNSSYQFIYPPVNLSTIDCPANFEALMFRFLP